MSELRAHRFLDKAGIQFRDYDREIRLTHPDRVDNEPLGNTPMSDPRFKANVARLFKVKNERDLK